jgi:medium-chain acyl-[acyl-carrier-protein] hydrolase
MKNSKPKDIWIDEYAIHSYEIDITGSATLPILCKFMQESAYHHAENLGFGFSHLMEKNLFWVLANQKIQMESYPRWGEKISIHTYPSGKGRLSYYRDFKIFDKKSKLIGKATTTWYAIDLQRRRPRRLEDYFEFSPVEGEFVFQERPDRLKFIEYKKTYKTFQAGYYDLDINDHVNNVRYIEWILECFSLDFHKSRQLSEIEINYMAEAVFGNSISASVNETENKLFSHCLIRSEDKKELCRARSHWKMTN